MPTKKAKTRRRRASAAAAAPTPRGSLRTGGAPKGSSTARLRCLRQRGTERLGTAINKPGNDNAATRFDINALSLHGLRVGAEFERFERWFVHHLRVRYVPSVPTTQAGNVHLMFDYDAADPTPAQGDPTTVMSRCYNYVSAPVSARCTLDIPNAKLPGGERMRGNLYCSPIGNSRLSQFGQVYCFVSGATGIAEDTPVGYLELEYDIEFNIPCAPSVITAEIYDGFSKLEFRRSPEPAWGGRTVDPTQVVIKGGVPRMHDGSTAYDAPFTVANAAGMRENVNAGSIYEAVIDDISEGSALTDEAGRYIRKGDKVYLRACSAPDYNEAYKTSGFDGMFTDLSFDAPLRWLSTALTFYIKFRQIKKILVSSGMTG